MLAKYGGHGLLTSLMLPVDPRMLRRIPKRV
jgi:hypothetical protein